MSFRYLKIVLFVCSSLSAIHLFAAAPPIALVDVDDSTKDGHLFELTPLFANDPNPTRRQWEQDFITFAKKIEEKPQGYVRHVLGVFTNGEYQGNLSDWRLSFTWNSNRYSYEGFASYAPETYQKEAVREGYLLSRISRDGDNIERLWGAYGTVAEEVLGVFFSTFPKMKDNLGILVTTWECISSTKKYKKKLDKLYQQLDTYEISHYELYEHLGSLRCPEADSKMVGDDFKYTSNREWIYSFWIRRHHEGNAEVVYTIFKSLIEE